MIHTRRKPSCRQNSQKHTHTCGGCSGEADAFLSHPHRLQPSLRPRCSQLTTHNTQQAVLPLPMRNTSRALSAHNKHAFCLWGSATWKTPLLPTKHTQLHAHRTHCRMRTTQMAAGATRAYQSSSTRQSALHTCLQPVACSRRRRTLQDVAACVHVHPPPPLKQQLVYKDHKAKRPAATDTLHNPHRGHR